jgi:F-type H+-transporting ATPase subunit alpha
MTINNDSNLQNLGLISSYKDGTANISGLTNVFMGEVLYLLNEQKTPCLVVSINENICKVLVLSVIATPSGRYNSSTYSASEVNVGMKVIRSFKTLSIDLSLNTLLGNVVNVLGKSLFSNFSNSKTTFQISRPVELKAPGVLARATVNQPLLTGAKIVDGLTPIGKGQRELIIGDNSTGKSTIVLDTFINQRRNNIISSFDGAGSNRLFCIYSAIGQKISSVSKFMNVLKQKKAFWYSSIVLASSVEPSAIQYISPYASTAMAEIFRDNGLHSLVSYDDLTNHAEAYRQLALALERFPGREAYPGDMFYAHSRLLERSAKMSMKNGNGSLTALPVVETINNDVSRYIPTNLISITDGQIFLDLSLFSKGIKPAMNVGISVSRVGSKAQYPLLQIAVKAIRAQLAEFSEVEALVSFGGDLDESTKKVLKTGQILVKALQQTKFSPVSVENQVLTSFLASNGYLENINLEEINSKLNQFLNKLNTAKTGSFEWLILAFIFNAKSSRNSEDMFKKVINYLSKQI